MSAIWLKAVEYPEEKVIELEQLTHLGLVDLKQQAEELIDTIEEMLTKGVSE